MYEGFVQGIVSVGAQDGDTFDDFFVLMGRCPGQVADRAGDYSDFVAFLNEEARQFMVAGPAGFVQGRKCLVDQENIH